MAQLTKTLTPILLFGLIFSTGNVFQPLAFGQIITSTPYINPYTPTVPAPYQSPVCNTGWSIRPGQISYNSGNCATKPAPCKPVCNTPNYFLPFTYYVGSYYTQPVVRPTEIQSPATESYPTTTLLPMTYTVNARRMIYVPSASGQGTVGIDSIGGSEVPQQRTTSPNLAAVSVETAPISASDLARLEAARTPQDLLALTLHEDTRIQAKARQALVDQGDRALPPLLQALHSSSQSLSNSASDVLAQVGAASLPHLLDMLQASQPLSVRIKAAHTLGKLGPAALPAVPVLTQLAQQETDRDLRFYLLTAVAKINR